MPATVGEGLVVAELLAPRRRDVDVTATFEARDTNAADAPSTSSSASKTTTSYPPEAATNASATPPADKPPIGVAAPTSRRTPPPNDKADEDATSTQQPVGPNQTGWGPNQVDTATRTGTGGVEPTVVQSDDVDGCLARRVGNVAIDVAT